jgi:hypothetical protein
METFAFPYHLLEVKYPDSSATVSFGGGYDFTSKPRAPDQVEYTANFKAMWFFTDITGEALDLTIQQEVNMGVLEAFYNRHKMWNKFWYPHPTQGLLKVRFNEPLNYKIVENGKGRVEPFSLRMILQP